jgi:phage shock protein A
MLLTTTLCLRSHIIEEQRQVERALRDQVASLGDRLREEQAQVHQLAAREAALLERCRALEDSHSALKQELEAARQDKVQAGAQAKLSEEEHHKVGHDG